MKMYVFIVFKLYYKGEIVQMFNFLGFTLLLKLLETSNKK
jgi:hypothetical protein